jgi:hypothetical protein
MAVVPNNTPTWTKQANNQSQPITVGSTNSEAPGTIGTNCVLLFTPGANDSVVDTVFLMPTASTAGTSTTATVARLYRATINSGATSSSNAFLISEVVLPSVSADSSSAANYAVVFPLPNGPISLQGSNNTNGEEYLLVSCHVAPAANTQWVAHAIARDY